MTAIRIAARLLAVCAAFLLGSQAWAQSSAASPLADEGFVIGTSGSACEALGVNMGEARRSVFERKWVVLCSDVAQPIGTAYIFRDTTDAFNRAASVREEVLDCQSPVNEDSGTAGYVDIASCQGRETGLAWRVLSRNANGRLYLVEGLAAYESALRLTLANLVNDRIVAGEVSIANLGDNDAQAIVRAKAAVSDVDTMIGQGYRGNSAGAYAEAAELFAIAPDLLDNDGETGEPARQSRMHELKINRALQLSNLGAFDQAIRLFDEARPISGGDPVQTRLARNYEAIDALNRRKFNSALDILDRPMPSVIPPVETDGTSIRINPAMAAGLNTSDGKAMSGILGQETRLTPTERARIIDAQAQQLRGTVLRLRGDTQGARSEFSAAYSAAMQVRDGRVTSIARLRSQILSELAQTYESQQRFGEAEALLRQAKALVERQYPDSKSVHVANARLAGFLARRGRQENALLIYRGITKSALENRDTLVGMENLMRPYFDLLTDGGATDPATIEDLFVVTQLAERPGAADTMNQLSRQLEAGDDEAASMYRQSLAVNRELERNRIAIARLNALADAGQAPAGMDILQEKRERLLAAQLELLTGLANYPQFRAVANRFATLSDLRESLKPGEAYLKLAKMAGTIYAVYISPNSARGWRVSMSAQELADVVAMLRESISITINGVQSTYPFEIDAAVELHDALFGPAAAEIASLDHLIFEPDGSMLQLPINLLTGDRQGVAAYHARVDQGGDEYDFTGIDWLGRGTSVSTALSATTFRDSRKAPASRAQNSYLGLGNNLPIGAVTQAAYSRSVARGSTDLGCAWPASAWNQPISDDELRLATGAFGRDRSALMTGAAFTDEAIIHRPDLDSFRIIHFATHGLVTAPNEGCPVRPALLTSFGPDEESDGLLSFKEIFDIRLDADLVVLSACDTAGQASLSATREAGVTSGGGQALDGLVRAFIAAGGRQIIASHWPAPDDFDATKRLFTSFYRNTDAKIGDALRGAQHQLMDDPLTSHPFYWAGFAIIGDADKAIAGR